MKPNKKMILLAEANDDFVETKYVRDITARALLYIEAGFPVHFRGPAGTGKSTLAKHVASKLGRPITLIHGDEELTTANLIGGEQGYHLKKVRDNFIASVLKEEESMHKSWVDNRLTVACKYGFTLIYDEYTRSRAEANNVLLSVLQDRMLTMSSAGNTGSPYLQVNPNFTAIFTSNPEEYAGVHKSQDALRDRMITIDIDFPDFETEVAILEAKSELPRESCVLIASIIRHLRASGECEFSPTIRAGIMISKTLQVMKALPQDDIDKFTVICQDILGSETSRNGSKNKLILIKDTIHMLVKDLTDNYQSFKAS